MPYVNNLGVRIHYEVEGEGPALVLQHGAGGSIESWYECGYVPSLKQDYQLILIDARGHGRSDKPRAPRAYTFELMADDVVTVLDEIGIGEAHFFGYSMGGRIGFRIAKLVPGSFNSFIIGGADAFSRPPGESDAQIQALLGGMEAYVVFLEGRYGPLPSEQRTRILQGDAERLRTLFRGLGGDSGIADVLPTMTMPCLLFAGDADPQYPGVRQCAQQMPNATLVTLPGLSHLEGFTRSDLVLPHVTTFLQEVSRGVRTAV